ncbi:MAG: hypothetical protein ACMXYK_03425 [Candidatus Woesearchaeota archaeon]
MKKISIIPLALLLVLAVFLAGCDVETNNNAVETQSNNNQNNMQESAQKSELTIGTKEDLNIKSTMDSFEITLEKYKVGYDEPIFLESDEKGNIAYLYFTIRNTGSESKTFYPQSFSLITDKGRQYQPEYDSTFYMLDSIYPNALVDAEAYFVGFRDDEKPKLFVLEIDDFDTKSTYEYNFETNKATSKNLIRCPNYEFAESLDACNKLEQQAEEKRQQELANQYKCEDGTLHETCSTNKPFYCSYGTLREDISKCGCEEGYFESNRQCVPMTGLAGFDRFSCSASQTFLTCSLRFVDNNNNRVNAEGNANIKILNPFNDILFENDFKVESSKYTSIGNFEISIPLNNIEKNIIRRTDIKIEFKDTSGSVVTSEDNALLTEMSDSEKKAFFDKRYFEKANKKTETRTFDGFKITLTSRGVYEDIRVSSINRYLRYDIEIENTNNERLPAYISPEIVFEGNEYGYSSYYSNIDSGLQFFNAGQKRTGTILFPEDTFSQFPISGNYELKVGTDYQGSSNYGFTYSYTKEFVLNLRD